MRSHVFVLLLLSLLGCGASSDPNQGKVPPSSGDEKSDVGTPGAAPGQDSGGSEKPSSPAEPGPGPNFSCRLPAPVSSDDSCAKDADCAPSVPCHARACVAVAKATPRTPDTMCTMNIDCQSADVNPCSCYQGRCALVPKKPD